MTILTTSSINPVARTASSGTVQRSNSTLAPVKVVEELPTPVQAQTAAPQLEEVQHAIERLKQSIKPTLANSLEFQIDQSTGKTLVKILDKETNSVVRQIPCEEMLTIARALDRMQGNGGFVKQQA